MKYEFASVLVADTRLLMDLSEPANYPRVLVLNSQLNESACSVQANLASIDDKISPTIILDNNNNNANNNCVSCCLRIEETEFKKRSDILIDEPEQQQQQCFAQCSERRLVNIELNTDSQIHGKMVLLALTKGLPSAHLLEENAALRCQTETSWFYSNFEQPPPPPPQQLDSQPMMGPKLRHYSMLKSNHLASMQIQSLRIQWNHQLRREIISIDVNPTRARKNQRVYRNETLLVSELACRSSSGAGSIAWTGKVHLLALINRELRAVTRASPLLKLSPPKVFELPRKAAASTGGAESDKSTMAADQVGSASKPAAAAAADDDEGDDRSLGSVMNIDRRSEIAPPPPPMQTHPFNYNQSHIMMDRVSNGGGGGGGHLTPPASNKWLELGGFHLQDGGAGGGGGGLGESIRMRLKSNSFLLFTVSSSFVILAYTLCLIIYLKSRRKPFRPNHRLQLQPTIGGAAVAVAASKAVKVAAPVAAGQRINQATSSNSSSNDEPQTMCISEPYNLQMSDATRTRMEMMRLKSNRKRKGRAARSSHPGGGGGGDGGNAMSQQLIAADQWWSSVSPRRQRRRGRQRDANRLDFESFGKRPAAMAARAAPDEVDELEAEVGIYRRGADCSPAIHFGYSTLDVVRAIRQAASVARLRLRNSRYEPNLNVIHESDSEHLQYCASTMGACRPFGGLIMDGRHGQQQQQQPQATMADDDDDDDVEQARRPIDDPVVQDALSLECSHFIERNHPHQQKTPSATLFSRPIEHCEDGSPPREQVSRSGILKLVKQDSAQFEDNHHHHDSHHYQSQADPKS